MLTDEMSYKLLKLLEEEPKLSQRELATQMGISLGKVNYCLRALVQKGLIKMRNFKNSSRKSKYKYLLTQKGLEEKSRITMHFLYSKMKEYEKLKLEILELKREVDTLD
ncbi:MAG: MarR family EPS-associated transcriptional regulator [Gammaproteobacteria bacterium]|nr:MarR family EPS-associated transcriptional regulator [Gammaproteobacteria bacterium]